MIRLILAATLASWALTGAAPGDQASFCPECWRFRVEPGALDSEVNCVRCRKPVVFLQTAAASWFWCGRDSVWRERPCRPGPAPKCCVERVARGLPASREREGTFQALYCPRCATFSEVSILGMPVKSCLDCRGPLVRVRAVERAWYWCAGDRAWSEERCPLHRTGKCCSPRSGKMLIVPTYPPGSWVSADPDGRLVSTAWLGGALHDPAVAVVHVGFPPDLPEAGERETYPAGHVPGARFLPWSEIATRRNGLPNEFPPLASLVASFRRLGLDESVRIVLYDTGVGIEAARAFVALELAGLGGTACLLDGQWKKWRADEGRTSLEPAVARPSSFIPRVLPEVVVNLERMKDLVWSAGHPASPVSIVDARPWAEFSGIDAGKGVRRGGHIPGAVHVYCLSNVGNQGLPIFREEEDLRRIYENEGIRPGKLVVAYCRTGRQAALTYFTARLLGHEARLYDGSFIEWSAREDLPVSISGVVGR